jgi:predicted alpha-1,2-mannosidase
MPYHGQFIFLGLDCMWPTCSFLETRQFCVFRARNVDKDTAIFSGKRSDFGTKNQALILLHNSPIRDPNRKSTCSLWPIAIEWCSSMRPSVRSRADAFRAQRARRSRAAACSLLLLLPFFLTGESDPAIAVRVTVLGELLRFANPLIGSGGHGHVFVGASVPFGLVQLGPLQPDCGWDCASGYHYSQGAIRGFAHTHLSGTGIPDLGDVVLQPYLSPVPVTEPHDGYASTFSHGNETAAPGYYAVTLDSGPISVALTATERCGFHRYDFPAAGQARVIVDLREANNNWAASASFSQVGADLWLGTRVTVGWSRRTVHFAVQLSEPPIEVDCFEGRKLVLGFGGLSRLFVKVGLSNQSRYAALSNLRAEIPGWDFDAVVKRAQLKWRDLIGRVTVFPFSQTFYTAVFHCAIHPSLFSDAGEPDRYTTFSLWDTYRHLHPLLTLITPGTTPDFVGSLLAEFRRSNSFPVWPLWGYETGAMAGVPSLQMVSEAIVKGVAGLESRAAYEAMVEFVESDQRFLDYERRLGFIPDIEDESVSQGLELCIGMASLAAAAEHFGDRQRAVAYKRRARHYQFYWDNHTGFFRGRMANGSFRNPFSPFATVDFTEGNAFSYLFLVPHDISGLIALLGGPNTFLQRLEELLATTMETAPINDLTGLIGQYAHGNEHSHHILYLPAYVGAQWRTAELVRRVMDDFYSPTVDGLIGNDDCGQMSAWYVFAAIGFSPVFPPSCEYVFGSPLFECVELRLGERLFTVRSIDGGIGRPYIQRATLNGKAYTRSYITHDTLLAGGELVFFMGARPNLSFGAGSDDCPHSSLG